MPCYNDLSPDYERWTNAKLMREITRVASFEKFGDYFREAAVTFGTQEDCGDFIRETTRIYRQTWLEPLLEEVTRRFVA